MKRSIVVVLALAACREPAPSGDDGGTTGGTGSDTTFTDTGTGTTTSDETTGSGSETTAGSDTGTELLGEGEPCTTAAECLPELICPYVSNLSNERVCTDPLDGIYDDGTRPQVELAGSWARVRVADWEERDARCNDGSPFAFYVSPGSGADANNWLIFLKGGGSCIDEEACARRWTQQQFFMRQQKTVSPNWSPGATSGQNAGLFARDEPTNHFADWTFVYIQYCSSDTFIGTALSTEGDSHLYFRGDANVAATIEHLISGVEGEAMGMSVPPLTDAERVVFAGGSAGAIGARHHMDRVADRIREVSPTATVAGWGDSSLIPPISPGSYTPGLILDFWDPALEDDCVEAHPDTWDVVCVDQLHLTTGLGVATHFGEEDSGHLGVPSSSQSYAVEGHFEFQAQFDGKLSSRGKVGMCIPVECTADGDCANGQGCLVGTCLDVEPCQPSYCTPDDEPCNGIGRSPTCFGEVASHVNVCDQGDDSTCAAGEQCIRGFCVQEGYAGCEDDSECPDGYACSGRVCSAGVESEGDCTMPGYEYTSDTRTCDQIIGCHPDNPCGAGYTCLWANVAPIAQQLSWGMRAELSGLAPTVGVYVPNSTTHTATIGNKYYGVFMPEVLGDTHAMAIDAWLTDPSSYVEHISLPENIPLPLWSEDIVSLTEGNVTENTVGSGCADDAVGFLVCDVAGACDTGTALAAFGVGDSGYTSVDGVTPSGPVALQIRVVPNPLCTTSTFTPASGAWLDLQYVVPTTSATHTMKIAIPAVPLGDTDLTVYVGADGAIYEDADLATLIVGRRE